LIPCSAGGCFSLQQQRQQPPVYLLPGFSAPIHLPLSALSSRLKLPKLLHLLLPFPKQLFSFLVGATAAPARLVRVGVDERAPHARPVRECLGWELKSRGAPPRPPGAASFAVSLAGGIHTKIPQLGLLCFVEEHGRVLCVRFQP